MFIYRIPFLPYSYVFFCCAGYPLDNVKQFSDTELRLATDNYHSNNKIGRGGFGTVYLVFVLMLA